MITIPRDAEAGPAATGAGASTTQQQQTEGEQQQQPQWRARLAGLSDAMAARLQDMRLAERARSSAEAIRRSTAAATEALRRSVAARQQQQQQQQQPRPDHDHDHDAEFGALPSSPPPNADAEVPPHTLLNGPAKEDEGDDKQQQQQQQQLQQQAEQEGQWPRVRRQLSVASTSVKHSFEVAGARIQEMHIGDKIKTGVAASSEKIRTGITRLRSQQGAEQGTGEAAAAGEEESDPAVDNKPFGFPASPVQARSAETPGAPQQTQEHQQDRPSPLA
eukprot:m51a1_g13523 hypothetical protein (276) ;mRNA; r:582-1638